MAKLSFTTSSDEYVMPFGKHAGEGLGKIPGSYLRWCMENFDWERHEELLENIEDVLGRRGWEDDGKDWREY